MYSQLCLVIHRLPVFQTTNQPGLIMLPSHAIISSPQFNLSIRIDFVYVCERMCLYKNASMVLMFLLILSDCFHTNFNSITEKRTRVRDFHAKNNNR